MDLGFIWIMILGGSASAIIFAPAKKMPSSVGWLKQMWPGHSDDWYVRRDFVLTWALGAVAAYFVFLPTNATQAFFAGLGSVSTIRMVVIANVQR
jgi:hypothetical protein